MPFRNEHSSRVRNPSLFEPNSFRSKELTDGIRMILGKLKSSGKMDVQTYRFNSSKYTPEQAKKWLAEHHIKYISFEKAINAFIGKLQAEINPMKNFHIARYLNPDTMAPNSFRVKIRKNEEFPDGSGKIRTIYLIIAKPKGKSEASDPTKLVEFRYPVGDWTATEARAHAKHNKASSFKAASGGNVQAFDIELLTKRIRSFSQDQIISLIPQDVYDKIIAKDNHPFFAMYSICHEGQSSPVVLGENNTKKITWTRRAIQSIKNIILKGVKLFKGHNSDSSHAGRRIIGKVIHSFQKEMNGKLHHIVITYHPKSVREEIKAYDVCSQESVWNFFEEAGNLIADSIEKLTGIALANSNEEKPAFAEAKRLGYIQAFDSTGKVRTNKKRRKTMANQNDSQGQNDTDQNYDDLNDLDQFDDLNDFDDNYDDNGGNPQNRNQQNNQKNQNQNNSRTNGKRQNSQRYNRVPNYDAIPFKEIIRQVRERNIFPSQIYKKEDIERDNNFVAIFDELTKWKENSDKQEKKIQELIRDNDLSTSKTRMTTYMDEEKIPPALKDFVLKEFDVDQKKIQDLSDDGLKKFIDEKTELFQRVSKTVNPEFKLEQQSGDNKSGNDGDYTKKENNELLSEDLDL